MAPLGRIPFTPTQEASISLLGKAMLASGVLTILTGVLGILFGIASVGLTLYKGGWVLAEGIGLLCQTLSFIFPVIFGFWLIKGWQAFNKVVTTDEDDQAYLAQGLVQLRNVFILKIVTYIVMFLTMIIFIVLGVGLAATFAALGSSF